MKIKIINYENCDVKVILGGKELYYGKWYDFPRYPDDLGKLFGKLGHKVEIVDDDE